MTRARSISWAVVGCLASWAAPGCVDTTPRASPVAANADPESIAAAFGGPSVARDVFVHGGRGFAFVSFTTPDAANMAMNQMQGQLIEGRQIRVEVSNT